jgi:arylsulfatase A-like enzyme
MKSPRLSTALSIAYAMLAVGGGTLKAAAQRPNILFIYTDDQSHRTVSCYPEAFPWVKTPNIDSLAQQGVLFSHAYIGAWCMPSRATMLTGHHQHGIESMRMEGQYPGSAYDPDKCPFWPKVFREHGYTTAHIGKWHTGVDGGFGRDWDHQIIWNRPALPANAPNYYYDQLTSFNGGEPRMVKGYTTDNYTRWAIEFINGKGRDPQKPWYLWLCYGAVHGPFTPADRHLENYPDIKVPTPKDVYPPRPGKPGYVDQMEFWERGKNGGPVERQVRKTAPVGMKDFPGRSLRDWVRQYHQGVLAIDEGVGRLLVALKESGQDENTIIVFTSDQGFAWGQHGFKSKVGPYDATVAAPLIIRPTAKDARQTAGRVVEDPVSGVDLPPTFFAQAGIDLPWKMHGSDLSPLLTNPRAKRSTPAMLVHTAKLYGSATATIPPTGAKSLYHGPGVPWYVMLAEGNFKYVRTLVAGEPEELYDLNTDPDELTNLAPGRKHGRTLRRLRAAAVAELKRTDAGFVDGLPKTATGN